MEIHEPIPESVTPGFALWLTGVPASGKSTLAQAMRRKLHVRGIESVIIDSDEMRKVLTPNPTYSPEERDWFYGALAQLSAWLTRSGVNVLIAATAHRRAYRDAARQLIEHFAEVHVCCASHVCQTRDPKGLYALSAAGKINTLPGQGPNYEVPINAEVVVETDVQTPDQAAEFVLQRLERVVSKENGPR